MNQLQVCRLQGVVNGKYNTYNYLFIKEIFLIKLAEILSHRNFGLYTQYLFSYNMLV